MCARTSGAKVVTIKNGGDKASNVPSTRAMINDGALVKSGDLVMTHALATTYAISTRLPLLSGKALQDDKLRTPLPPPHL